MSAIQENVVFRAEQSGLTVALLEPTIGAEIGGLDLRKPLAPELRDELRALLLKYKVIFFRDQDINREQQVAFARNFGETLVHPSTRIPDANVPQAHIISIEDARKTYDVRFGVFHSDYSWHLTGSLGAVLRAVTIPEVGGDTIWADAGAVYRGLSPELRDKIDDLYVIHDFQGSLKKVGYRYPTLSHPLVRTHPETGEEVLFINFSQKPWVVGWDRAESQALVDELHREFYRPEYQVRFKWRQHSVAFWDNRATLHYPVHDYGDFPRVMERVLIASDDIPHRVRRVG